MPSIKNITGLYDNRMQEEQILTLDLPTDTNENILTPREIEYLALAALGFKNLQIAEILVVTQSTVKKMLESIFSKLNAKDRTHAVTICFLHELLSGSYLCKFYICAFKIFIVRQKFSAYVLIWFIAFI